MNESAVFIEPLDVLFPRGNKLFGDAGSFGEALIPPWPSAVAGALRSRMLVDAGIDLGAFAAGKVKHEALGGGGEPGPFSIAAFTVARRTANGHVEILMPPPADLYIATEQEGTPFCRLLRPHPCSSGIASSALLPQMPVLAEKERSKPAGGYWLNERAWTDYLRGRAPAGADLVKTSNLWTTDLRVGVGLDAATRRASDGRLFTVQALAMHAGVGFLAAVSGARPPTSGFVRFGGDGRGAALRSVDKRLPQPDYEAIARARCCRLVLVTPGIFEHGWLPTGARPHERRADGAVCFAFNGVSGWIVSAAVPRAEVVSGWDIAAWQPKPALRAAPTGSVWWLELDDGVGAEALRKLVERGLWTEEQYNRDMRRAEGFNRCSLAAY